MKMLPKIAAAAFAAGALIAVSAPAQAVTYDAVTGFAQTSSVWQYGMGSVGAGFSALPNYMADGCVGAAGLACHNNVNTDYTFPAIAKTTGGALVLQTNEIAADQLFIQSLPGVQAILRFVAPTSGHYTFNGVFSRIDNRDGAGDGVDVGVFSAGNVNTSAGLGTSRPASYTYTGGFNLLAGQTVDFFVDARGNTYNDGTGLTLSASVPEPATWALMIGGFGLAGAALRRRRGVAFAA